MPSANGSTLSMTMVVTSASVAREQAQWQIR
jgi:hypothetical protein